MLRTRIPTQTAGVYIYRAKKQVWIDEVNRELVIVLCCAPQKLCGVVVYPNAFVVSELFELLGSLKQKFCGELKIPADQITAKIFGCSAGQTNALFASQVWLTDQGFQIGGMDTGRNVTRSLVVDCATAKVGVRFADVENDFGAGFLPAGTAAQRVPRQITPGHAILVTGNRSFALLGKQALESETNWKVEKVSTKDFLAAAKKNKATWLAAATIIVVFEDVLETPKLAPAILALRKKTPHSVWVWAVADGAEVPLPMDAVQLPSADKPGFFLEQVNRLMAAPKPPMGTVHELPKKRRAR